MIEALKVMNAGLAFLLELAMLAAFGFWGFHGEKAVSVKWILGIGLPLLTAVLWGIFLAPRSAYRLNSMSGSLLSLILFLLAAAALFDTQYSTLAIIFALTALMNRILILLWRQW